MESAPYPGFVDSTRSITWRTSATAAEPSSFAAASVFRPLPLPQPAPLNAFTTSIKQSHTGRIKWEKASARKLV